MLRPRVALSEYSCRETYALYSLSGVSRSARRYEAVRITRDEALRGLRSLDPQLATVFSAATRMSGDLGLPISSTHSTTRPSSTLFLQTVGRGTRPWLVSKRSAVHDNWLTVSRNSETGKIITSDDDMMNPNAF